MMRLAIQKHNASILELLLSKKANLVESYGESKDTPLHVACRNAFVDGVVLLLNACSKTHTLTEARNQQGETPLMIAVDFGLSDVVRVLLERGANADLQLPKEQNLLHLAAK